MHQPQHAYRPRHAAAVQQSWLLRHFVRWAIRSQREAERRQAAAWTQENV